MSSSLKQEDLLGTSSSLLAKWSTEASSLLGTSALSSGSATKSAAGDERKRKPAKASTSGAVGEKKSKAGGSGLLSGGSLTGGLSSGLLSSSSLSGGLSLTSTLSSGLLSAGSLLGPSKLTSATGLSSLTSGLSLKLESPLSNLRLEESRSAPLSHASGLPSGTGAASKPSSGLRDAGKSAPPAPPRRQKSPVRAKKTEAADTSRSKLGKSKKKKMKLDGKIVTPGARAYERMVMPPPEYDLRTDEVRDDEPMELTCFVPPEKDVDLMGAVSSRLQDVEGLKNGLINAVSASLLCSPNFRDPRDQARDQLMNITAKVVVYDPEFVLKVALYCRRELNIRTTTNFLLALASNRCECRPYLRKYYSASIMLPSDWIEVAEVYQAFKDRNLNFGSLPAALRKVMITKFSDFDKYQLAKYNKEKSGQKKKKKEREKNKEESKAQAAAREVME